MQEILSLRLYHQHLSHAHFREPAPLVSHLVALQAQDFSASKAALATRLPGITESEVEAAIAKGSIIRTWMMRGTIQLTTPADLHWILRLLGPRLHRIAASRNRQLGLEPKTVVKYGSRLLKALEHGPKTREALLAVLSAKKITLDGLHLSHVLQHLAFNAELVFAPREGSQYAFSLAPADTQPALTNEEAAARLARRYYESRGPATAEDFSWWSGLPLTVGRAATEAAAPSLHSFRHDQTQWWMNRSKDPVKNVPVLFLPPFDEYVLAYRNRSHFLREEWASRTYTTNGIFNAVVLMNGMIAGTWKKKITGSFAEVTIDPFRPFLKKEEAALKGAAAWIGAFYGKPLKLHF